MIVDLRAIQENFLALQRRSLKCFPVVKGDAYGHGLEACALALAAVGADALFVAHYHEALAVRCILPEITIGVLNGLEGNTPTEFVKATLEPVLGTLEDLSAWRVIADKYERAPCYIQIDTGMNRLGIPQTEVPRLLSMLRSHPLQVSGYISHFARSDEGDVAACEFQLSRFRDLTSLLPRAPLSIANSAGIALGLGSSLSFTRPGKAIFGIESSFENDLFLKPTARVVAPVVQVRTVSKGEAVGYGSSWVAGRESTLAIVGLGYQNGLQRAVAHGGKLLYQSSPTPIVGRVSMDLVVIDITDVVGPRPLQGDWIDVVAEAGFGPLAKAAGTIEHELAISMGRGCYRTFVE